MIFVNDCASSDPGFRLTRFCFWHRRTGHHNKLEGAYMKKVLTLVSFLVLAAACTTQPAGNGNTTANANKAGETKSMAGPSEADLIARRKRPGMLSEKRMLMPLRSCSLPTTLRFSIMA
jgi:hypothetical protein